MTMSFSRILPVALVLSCCLVSIVSAGCAACSATPEGGWGPPDYSKNPYWGMSIDDIIKARSSSSAGDSTSGSSSWQPPALVLPTSGAGKFSGLFDYTNKFGESQSLFGKNASSLKPGVDVKPGLMNKNLFF